MTSHFRKRHISLLLFILSSMFHTISFAGESSISADMICLSDQISEDEAKLLGKQYQSLENDINQLSIIHGESKGELGDQARNHIEKRLKDHQYDLDNYRTSCDYVRYSKPMKLNVEKLKSSRPDRINLRLKKMVVGRAPKISHRLERYAPEKWEQENRFGSRSNEDSNLDSVQNKAQNLSEDKQKFKDDVIAIQERIKKHHSSSDNPIVFDRDFEINALLDNLSHLEEDVQGHRYAVSEIAQSIIDEYERSQEELFRSFEKHDDHKRAINNETAWWLQSPNKPMTYQEYDRSLLIESRSLFLVAYQSISNPDIRIGVVAELKSRSDLNPALKKVVEEFSRDFSNLDSLIEKQIFSSIDLLLRKSGLPHSKQIQMRKHVFSMVPEVKKKIEEYREEENRKDEELRRQVEEASINLANAQDEYQQNIEVAQKKYQEILDLKQKEEIKKAKKRAQLRVGLKIVGSFTKGLLGSCFGPAGVVLGGMLIDIATSGLESMAMGERFDADTALQTAIKNGAINAVTSGIGDAICGSLDSALNAKDQIEISKIQLEMIKSATQAGAGTLIHQTTTQDNVDHAAILRSMATSSFSSLTQGSLEGHQDFEALSEIEQEFVKFTSDFSNNAFFQAFEGNRVNLDNAFIDAISSQASRKGARTGKDWDTDHTQPDISLDNLQLEEKEEVKVEQSKKHSDEPQGHTAQRNNDQDQDIFLNEDKNDEHYEDSSKSLSSTADKDELEEKAHSSETFKDDDQNTNDPDQVSREVMERLEHCFTADTLVLTPYGAVAIGDLIPGDYVTGYDHKAGQLVERQILAKRAHQQPIVTIKTSAGVFRLTENHRFYMTTGQEQAYREIELYNPSASLLSAALKPINLRSYANNNQVEEVVDIQVEDIENFFIVGNSQDIYSNSILVHNCNLNEIMAGAALGVAGTFYEDVGPRIARNLITTHALSALGPVGSATAAGLSIGSGVYNSVHIAEAGYDLSVKMSTEQGRQHLVEQISQTRDNALKLSDFELGQAIGANLAIVTSSKIGSKSERNQNHKIVQDNNKSGSVAKKWSRKPKSLQDEMALKAAKNDEGKPLRIKLNDPKYKGMEKMEYKVKSENGKDTVVHYIKDPKTGETMDFKFKKHSTD